MNIDTPDFQKKLDEGEAGLSQDSRKVLGELLDKCRTTDGEKDEKMMFTHAAIITVFAWELEGKHFTVDDVYSAFQSQEHFNSIFKSDWYTLKVQETLNSWAGFGQKF
tara:strand:- start:92 stop:415 length:324 start_codon:yes stop_codon:yes gene_type:complete